MASEAAAGIGGRLVGPDVEFDGASFDTRSIQPGQLFVPIVAERNGHDFIGAAYDSGAALHLSSEPDPFRRDHTAIEVNDTADALMRLAGWARQRSSARVVGVTGSVGKTSTKDLIAAACAASLRTTANERSFNNEQGLPITMLNAPDDTEVLVLEMGMRGFGQITELCEIARPEIGVVTTVGHSHTEMVGGIEGVARAKAELVAALPASGVAILNADDERVAAMARNTGASVLTFGTTGDVRISELTLDQLARPRFRLDTPWGDSRVELELSGEHMAMNAAAAIAVAGSLGVELDAAVAALSTATISGMRMEMTELPSGAIVVDDTYNANPTSMAAALDALVAMSATRRFAILGLMGELDDPGEGHRDVARKAEALGVQLVATGTELYGVRPTDDPVGQIGELGAGDVVLVKASRSAGLERVVAQLLG
ncbi:UDP-N-acetylmuramoyl-tripeptide--D-alanyl-D-alanine ligase [Ilumatobacter coccineus]|uniref:UDP-N-acetylmuramoyl-tripeptide--D-alanyl-D-alanine ligase n=1 Tax=Ilumatobacter coccineus (strain NBRC 103263 / KCTC 29153 / YM16-304) TaxID=1313172 RepID=A0A6C7E3M5_ILUCY|nr:UDP-N-acetylmuramoyl-tripeptide--D-alanyl-D-alanine ligase [Ilumatobacter coccineus]BAN02544.1 UDP-N-acetylmuramoyl-tripeptide--D-alanyl-D-alanine ligase [Ilumatobacter coccineus YM16-304]